MPRITTADYFNNKDKVNIKVTCSLFKEIAINIHFLVFD